MRIECGCSAGFGSGLVAANARNGGGIGKLEEVAKKISHAQLCKIRHTGRRSAGEAWQIALARIPKMQLERARAPVPQSWGCISGGSDAES